ncbi:N-acetyltransferase [Actinocatenispora thailandica]|uniref:N-acetyltransferase n=1 Tax=Actinocatenispora thailandica TaxID=227318 RepID=A0A7R7DUD2_9ACTN|nr:GNAT family N-acetyltransferase [Actinocatenispora thailandica]BCJ37975.1 N-acetyltransferase [Actinocatenispora thailandica]
MLDVRVLTGNDWALWREVRLDALREAPYAYGSTYADWVDADEQRWRDRLDGPGFHNVLVLLDGAPAGIATGVPTDDPDVAELISMYVRPAARGHGVGDRLIDEVAAAAAATGAHTLRLNVTQGNAHAGNLYARNGFHDVAPNPEPGRNGVRYERTMIRRLDRAPRSTPA